MSVITTMIMSNLPEDLVEEILCRIPATYVKKLRSTCKQWNNLFNNRRFTRNHFDKAPKQFLSFILKEFRVCSMTINLHGIVPSVEVKSELSLLDPLHNNSYQFLISRVFHCDGLLLCIDEYCTRIVVWNPCTGQKRWIQPRHGNKLSYNYALGSYQDSKSGNNSYKILCCSGYDADEGFEIYEINSNSWRVLDVTRDCALVYTVSGVSLKGKTYWFAWDKKEEELGMFLVSFDYTTKRFGRLSLPPQCPKYEYRIVAISVVREEKVSVLLQPLNTSTTEIWVTNKIDETKKVSWSMVLAVDLNPELDIYYGVSFLVDEEKKVLVFCDKCFGDDETYGQNMVYIAGVDNQVRQVDLGLGSNCPFLFNYVPSLTQIQQRYQRQKKKRRMIN